MCHAGPTTARQAYASPSSMVAARATATTLKAVRPARSRVRSHGATSTVGPASHGRN
ncbi:hypothetical protein LEMLEM_LOCUS27235 [Lemmus lemmus]